MFQRNIDFIDSMNNNINNNHDGSRPNKYLQDPESKLGKEKQLEKKQKKNKKKKIKRKEKKII